MRRQPIFRLVVLWACLLLYGCNLPSAPETIGQIGSVQTWIDAPLDGSTIPLAPYEIVLHAYDPAGVTQVELNANGSLLTTLPNANPGQHLATVKYLWSPAAPGNYTLTARGKSSNGLAGSAATALITVVGSIPRPVIAVTSATATPTSTPTPSPGPLAFTPRLSVNQFYYGTCTPNRVTIQVFVSGGNASSVVLFQKLKDQASGVSTDWDDGSSMTPSGDGWFSRTIAAASVSGADSVSESWLLYQFVATGNTGQAVGRSQVYSDITLSSCGAPLRRIITPTSPGIIVIPPPIIRRAPPTATLIPPPK
jgi:hypothetical protein